MSEAALTTYMYHDIVLISTTAAAAAATTLPSKEATTMAKGKGSTSSKSPSKAVPINERHSVSVRRIANGYITSTTTCRGSTYTEREEFSAKKPTVKITTGNVGSAGNGKSSG